MNEMQRQELIEEFMEEVESIASELDDGALPLEDLVQEGYVGLMKGLQALEKEEYGEEAAFGGLSVSETLKDAIRQALEEAIDAQRARLNQDDRLVVQVELMNRSIERLTEELGTKPNIDEIANDMKISQEMVLKILKLTGEGISDEAFIPPAEEGEPATTGQ